MLLRGIINRSTTFFLIYSILIVIVSSAWASDDYFALERFDKEYDTSSLPLLEKRLRLRLDHVASALAAFKDALRLAGEEQFEDAIRSLQRSLALWPEFLPAHLVLAGLYETTANNKRAFVHYRKYLELLQKLEEDKLAITGGILYLVGFDQFERYDEARIIINEKLRAYGFEKRLKYVAPVVEKFSSLDVFFKNPYIVSFLGLLIVAIIIFGIFGEDVLSESMRRTFLLGAVALIFVFIFWYLFKITANSFWITLAYLTYPLLFVVFLGVNFFKEYQQKHKVAGPGCWICKHCGTENPNVYYACQECSHQKPA